MGPGLWVVGCTCLYVCTKPEGEFVYPLMRVRMHVRWVGLGGGKEIQGRFCECDFFSPPNC